MSPVEIAGMIYCEKQRVRQNGTIFQAYGQTINTNSQLTRIVSQI